MELRYDYYKGRYYDIVDKETYANINPTLKEVINILYTQYKIKLNDIIICYNTGDKHFPTAHFFGNENYLVDKYCNDFITKIGITKRQNKIRLITLTINNKKFFSSPYKNS